MRSLASSTTTAHVLRAGLSLFEVGLCEEFLADFGG
jgi:hypothetical protein